MNVSAYARVRRSANRRQSQAHKRASRWEERWLAGARMLTLMPRLTPGTAPFLPRRDGSLTALSLQRAPVLRLSTSNVSGLTRLNSYRTSLVARAVSMKRTRRSAPRLENL